MIGNMHIRAIKPFNKTQDNSAKKDIDIGAKVNGFYFAGLVLYVVSNVMGYATIANLSLVDALIGYARWCAVFCFLIRITLYCAINISKIKCDYKFIAISIVLLTISVTSYLCAGEKTVFPVAMLIISSYEISFKKIAKTALVFLTLTVLLLIIFSMIGVLDFNVVARGTNSAGQRVVRYAFSFGHPNDLGAMCVLGFVLYVCLKDGKLNIASSVVFIALVAILVTIVDSRTAALTILVGIATCLVLRELAPRCHLVRYGVIVFSVVCVTMGIGLVVLYRFNPELIEPVNNLLSDRLYYANEFLSDYSISLFGQPIEIIGSVDAFKAGVEAHVLDNIYFHLLIHYGILTFVVYFWLYCSLFKRSFSNGSTGIIVSIVLMAFIGISETWPFSFVGSFVLCAILSTHSIDDNTGKQASDVASLKL